MNVFDLTVLAAEKPFYEGECASLVIPTINGQYGILAYHYNMTAAISAGMLKIEAPDGAITIAAVSAGLVKVEDNKVLILVDTAERPEEIDENRARRAAAQAQEEILQRRSIREYHAAQARMARELNRLRVKKHTQL